MPNQLPTAEELARKCAESYYEQSKKPDNPFVNSAIKVLAVEIQDTIPLAEFLTIAEAAQVFVRDHEKVIQTTSGVNLFMALNNLHSKLSTTKENE